MQVRPVTGMPRARYRVVGRFALWVLRWTFISIGAVTAASVLFAHLYRVNEEFYDPRNLPSASPDCSRSPAA